MDISQFCIEVTRKCNLSCEHCFRGDAQNLDIKNEYIYEFLKNNKIKRICSLLFTGGEPSLNVSSMDYTLKVCKELNIMVCSFSIVTNGVKKNFDFLRSILEWSIYVTNLNHSCLTVSNSRFHESQDEDWKRMLGCLSFYKKQSIYLDDESILGEGRGAIYNELTGVGYKKDYNNLNIILQQKEALKTICNESSLYLNAIGDIILDCDFSYESQEKVKIGNAMNMTLEEMIENKKKEYIKRLKETISIQCKNLTTTWRIVKK